MGQARILDAATWGPPRAAAKYPHADTRAATDPLVVFAALGLHLLIAVALRTIAWPEVTTPAYLTSQGLLLYRDIKFVHTPGMISLLGLFFAVLGVSGAVLRLFALIWPLLAHVALLAETRRFPARERLLTSALFLVMFYLWQGNSVWPSVVMSALALPVVWQLARGRMASAGALIGIAILIKQTAAFLLFVVVARLLLQRRWSDAARVGALAVLPYAAAALLFTALGAGADYVRWTLLVPFTVLKGEIDAAPNGALLFTAASAFLPLLLQTILERPRQYRVPAQWHLLVASGFALMAYPRFGFLNLLASVPSLAVGAGRLLRDLRPRIRRASLAIVSVLTLSRAAVLFAGETFDRRILFWDENPAFNRLVASIGRLPASAPLAADLWENILPRTGRLPPGGIYVHPWLTYLGPVDDVGNRSHRAALAPGTIFVRYRGPAEAAETVGPYAVERR